MADEIIIALITGFLSLLGTAMTVRSGNKKNAEIAKEQAQVTIYRIDQLEKKVEKHNNVIERVYNLEKNEAVMEEEIKVVNHRIGDLEEFHK